MASSSSSSSQSWSHDVFLSFRGTDTRKTFVDHLYSALVQQGIKTYKDDQTLDRGETIGPSLLKAIEESRIAVIVFSENYADSSWCLDELAYIMKCKNERGQIVMPTFYHIDPSEVRKQKRKYGEAFAKYDESAEKKKVEAWRNALTDVGNLSGWETKHIANGHEAKCIKEIVDTISTRLCATISRDNEDFIGLRDRLQVLKTRMEMKSDGVVMVGIWGIGGGGKTTLASALYDDIFNKFDGCCFLDNIREESSKSDGLLKLQGRVLSLVLKQQMEVNRIVDGRRLIKSRLCRKKVLIVLDDVDHLDQLKALAGSHDWFGEGSRIIITTRNNHLLNVHNVNVMYNVCLLNDDEAIQLFCKHAPRHDGWLIEDYERLSQDVVSYANGLPLALIVLGSFLCDKDKSEWTSALERLRDIPDIDIVEKLKISYDGLKPMEKELFLDIACFFRGEDNNEAMRILDACGYHPIIGVKVLIQKALITVSKSGDFDMHDMIQEMGHYIVRGENPKNPELHSRVWQEEDVVKICAMDATMENERIEALQVFWDLDVPPSLPQVVANMKKLRWISCGDYPATSISREFQPMKLCYLSLRYSFLEQLWEGYKYLPNLKVLDLSFSENLVRTPDFDGLPCLERIILKNCTNLKEIHPSIGYHERLIFLNMEYCESLEMFPPIIRMKKLETLILSGCCQLCMVPEIRMNMDKLSVLNLRFTMIKSLPSSIGQYCTNLLSLDLSYCHDLQSIEGNFHLLKHLKELYLHGCDQLENTPREGLFDVECCLDVLSLSLTFFKNLGRPAVYIELLGLLHSLRSLSLESCNLVDGDISSFFCELSNLQALDLSGNEFSRLHSSLSQLPRLKFLDLSNCFNLVELPDLPLSIAILVADCCDSLEIVDLPTKLKWLWKVSLKVNSKRLGYNVKRLVQYMLQGNAVEDYFISLCSFRYHVLGTKHGWETFTLQLPWNWYNEFSGFLIQVNYYFFYDTIIIKDVMDRENAIDVLEVSDEIDEREEMDTVSSGMCYISFGSLRHTSWWNSTHTTISFSLGSRDDIKVELVPIRSKGDSMERAQHTTNTSEYWFEEAKDGKTFEIKHDSDSCIEIEWRVFG